MKKTTKTAANNKIHGVGSAMNRIIIIAAHAANFNSENLTGINAASTNSSFMQWNDFHGGFA